MRAIAIVLLAAQLPAWTQVCRLSVAGLNRNRRVTGDIASECPDPLHTAPFGNWGVTSNFGPRRDGHQFDGWCRDKRVCDNSGVCFSACRDGWYEWNSCTTHVRFKAPNCDLFNAQGCTSQETTQGINVLGTQTVDVPVTCPRLAPDGKSHDAGGCLDIREYERPGNFMSAYELDPFTGDDLVQTIHYPTLTVYPECNVWGCGAAGSDWVNPIAWSSPQSPAKVFAELAMVVNSGSFVDTAGVCRPEPVSLEAVSSASYSGPELAPDSMVTLYANGTALATETATSQPLPLTLAGVQVRVTPAGGTGRQAALSHVSPSVLNAVLPASLPEGDAVIAIVSGASVRAQGAIQIARTRPGIFSADASGSGPAAATASRPGQSASPIYECGGEPRACRHVPIELGDNPEQVLLSIFGTGIRGRSALEGVTATIGGEAVGVTFAGAHPGTAGLDRIDLSLPSGFVPRGELEVNVTVDGRAANPVTVLLR